MPVEGSSSNKRARTKADFEAQLGKQRRFLKASCDRFDAGEHDEAVRIATTLRILLHDTKRSTSLLKHLGLKDEMRFVDTGVYPEAYVAALNEWVASVQAGYRLGSYPPSDVGLVELGVGRDGRVGWYAPLRLRRFQPGSPPDKAMAHFSAFADWWDKPLVEASTKRHFARSYLVKIMANQDGGAHIDASLDADYEDLCYDNLGTNVVVLPNRKEAESYRFGGSIPSVLNNVAYASVRQIAFELEITLQLRERLTGEPGFILRSDPSSVLDLPSAPHEPMGYGMPSIIVPFEKKD